MSSPIRTANSAIVFAASVLAAAAMNACAEPQASPRAATEPVMKPWEQTPRGSNGMRQGYPSFASDLSRFLSPPTLKLQDFDGKDVALTVAPRTLVVGVASWCPASRQFVEFVKDRRIQSMLAGYTLAFVLADEWSDIESKLKEQDPSLASNPALLRQELEARKENAGGGPLYDPDFLDTLPGAYYLHADPDGVNMRSFPTLYDAGKSAFDEHPTLWIAMNLAEKAGMSTERFVGILESHGSH